MIGGGGERRAGWLLDVWSRRKWLGIVVFAVTLVAGVTAARYVPNVYEATATVLVEEPQTDLAAASRLDRRLQQITQEIQSRTRLEQLIQAYGLYPQLRSRYPAEVAVLRMRRDIRTEFKAPPVAGGAASTLAFAITYRAGKPETTARVANALAAFYLEEDVKLRGRKAGEAVQVLKEQLDDVTQKLQEQRQKMGASPVDSPADLPQQTSVDLAALGRLHADLRSTSDERLRALDRRNDILRRLAEAESTDPAAPTVEAPTRLARLKGELADLRRRFSDKYPDVVRMQAEIAALEEQGATDKPAPAAAAPVGQSAAITRLKESLTEVDAEISKLKSDEESFRSEVATYTQRIDSAPRRQRALEEVSRDYQATRDTYDSLRRRYEQARLDDVAEGSSGDPRFRILDAAVVPMGAAAPNRLMLLGLAFAAALGLALGAVALTEHLDTSFHAVDDVAAFATVPVLASIPRIVTERDRRRQRLRFGVATVSLLMGLLLVATTFRSLSRVEDGLIATLARGRS
jgi:polysaccharide chain length determinant protein (PEP-CTERM system associated)